MSRKHLFSKITVALAICGMLFAAGIWMRGQGVQGVQASPAPQAITASGVQITGLPDDWTHHHLVFSNPGTEDQALANGTHQHWLSVVNDPRYIMQQLKRHAPVQGPLGAQVAEREQQMNGAPGVDEASLLGGPLVWKALRKPARARNRAESNAIAVAGLQLAMLAMGLAFATVVFGRREWASTMMLVLSTGAFLLLASCGSAGVSNSVGTASGLAVNTDWSMDLGTDFVGGGVYPAKYSFDTTAAGQCSTNTTPDYVVYNTGHAGSTTQANIIAYDNIYTGCSGSHPLVYWSYYTGAGTVETSPVLSEDGTKVAFIETPGTGAATLRILRFAASNGTNYSTPFNISSTTADCTGNTAPCNYTNTYAGATTNTAWTSCTTDPCMISVTFQEDTNDDATSSPWYDYASDTIYVGDSAGYIHQITGVFKGTPGESIDHAAPGTCGTVCPWPAAPHEAAGRNTTDVVEDSTAGYVYAGISDGKIIVANVSTGATAYTNTIGNLGTTDIADAPLVDSSAARIYAFVSDDGATPAHSGVFQFTEPITGAGTAGGTEATVGTGATMGTVPLYAGDFDNTYYTSSNPASPTGHLWVCGDTGGHPTLYGIAITGNTMGTVTTGPAVSGSTTTCSPVSEFCTNAGANCTSSAGTDYIFVSPTLYTAPAPAITGCTVATGLGCVISFTVSGTTTSAGAGGPFAGGASGMIIDNQSTSPSGTANLYFGILGSGTCAGNGTVGSGTTSGCAIQASQAAP